MINEEMKKAELEELLGILEKIKGHHTELVTVYIPADYDVNATQRQLEGEKSTAKNIKSTSTRKNVTEALEKIVRFLKEFKKTPPNGMAVFCGNVSEVEGQQDLQLWSIEPPQPLNTRLYRCDKEFVLDALKEQFEIKEVYGLLVMDRKEATIGLLVGKRVELLHRMTSGVPSKVRAGGQCLSPNSWVNLNNKNKNIIDLKINDKIRCLNFKSNKIVFTKVKNKWGVVKKRILEVIVEDGESIICSLDHTFFKKSKFNIKEVIARDLMVGDVLICSNNHDILELKIINIKEEDGNFKLVDIETEEGNFFANGILVHNSAQRFHRITEGLTKEFYKRIAEEMKKTFSENKKLKGILIGGPIPTKDEFMDGKYLPTPLQIKVMGVRDIGDSNESGLKELVTKSQDILSQQESIMEKKLLEKFFETLGANPDKAAYDYKDVKKALEMGAVDTLILSKKLKKEISKELIKMAENISSNLEIVSTETTEGEQFYNISGIGALLRYKI